MAKNEIDDVSGVETTGHEWDGIKELNNPLPRWWLWTFYATIIWAVGYMIAYPAIPLINSNTKGLLGYSSRADVDREMTAAAAARSGLLEKVRTSEVAEILADDEMRQFSIAAGGSAFKVYCSQCHGSGAQGGPGYPNLNDDAWIWGGDIDAIHATIAHGVRFDTDEDTRISDMPAFGDILESDEIRQVSAYVKSLTGTPSDTALVEPGKVVYEDNCAVCHGDDAAGMAELGAPNLADAIWLYGDSEADIITQVSQPKHGVMPAWQARLGEAGVKQLSVYVHSLGGGQ